MPIVIIAVVGTLVGGVVLGVDPVVDFVKSAVEGLAAIADAAIALLPDAADLDLDAETGWLWSFGYFNTFMPVAESLVYIGIYIGVRLAVFAWRMADRIWHLIPKPLSGT